MSVYYKHLGKFILVIIIVIIINNLIGLYHICEVNLIYNELWMYNILKLHIIIIKNLGTQEYKLENT